MCYEGCRLPTYRGCRFSMGPHWCAMKAVGCQPKRIGPHWCPMKAAGCRYTVVPGLRIGVDWCAMKAVGCQPKRMGPHWCPMKAAGCRYTVVPGLRIGVDWCAMKAVGCQPKRMGPIDVLWRWSDSTNIRKSLLQAPTAEAWRSFQSLGGWTSRAMFFRLNDMKVSIRWPEDSW